MRLLDLVLPRRCGVCGRIGESVCAACLARLVRCVPPCCDRCGAPGPWPVRRCAECSGRRLAFAQARAALVYEDGARAFVASWKERGRRDLAAVAAQLVVAAVPRPAVDMIAFVPGDRDRGLARGHASAAALAHELSLAWSIPSGDLLQRRPGVRRQRDLPRADRRGNVAGVFSARGSAPRRVCLVDDVYTTGSTATACATSLRRAGASHVEVVSLARAVR
jgi:predicted amidophosphoribosyltransferase